MGAQENGLAGQVVRTSAAMGHAHVSSLLRGLRPGGPEASSTMWELFVPHRLDHAPVVRLEQDRCFRKLVVSWAGSSRLTRVFRPESGGHLLSLVDAASRRISRERSSRLPSGGIVGSALVAI